MSITCTTTPGHTFTDETIEDADLNDAASPIVSITNGVITPSEIDPMIWDSSTRDITSEGTASWQCNPGCQFQLAYITAYADNIVMNLYNVENGMIGRCAIWAGQDGVAKLTPSADGFTSVIDKGLAYLALSPATINTRFLMYWYAGNDMIFFSLNSGLVP